MAYYNTAELNDRVGKIKKILQDRDLDFAVIYYDEFNVANGWYITAWCPQFESGAVLIPKEGEPLILGGPESEPFAKQDSAVRETRNLPVFMVPDEEYPNAKIDSFAALFDEISHGKKLRRAGIVGADQMPVSVYRQVKENFTGVEIVDITDEFLKLRHIKSGWEIEQIRKAFLLADHAYDAMKEKVAADIKEYEVAAAGETAARIRGASGFAFKTIVGSGKRSNAVVPTAMDKVMTSGETVMLGISPRWNGYSSVFGDTLPVSGNFSHIQLECYKHLKEVMRLTKEQLVPGKTGKQVDAPGRAYFEKIGYSKYLVCPFAHTIGLMEAEAPFFGPNSNDVIRPGMTVCVDISLFGHPDLNGMRIETGYEITDKGAVPFSIKMDKILLG
jgi:Xaa-Pro aminopeptidase